MASPRTATSVRDDERSSRVSVPGKRCKLAKARPSQFLPPSVRHLGSLANSRDIRPRSSWGAQRGRAKLSRNVTPDPRWVVKPEREELQE